MQIAPSKNLLAAQRIAADLLGRGVGERAPTALRYQELLGVGSGTVQKALKDLEEPRQVRCRLRQSPRLTAALDRALLGGEGSDPAPKITYLERVALGANG